MDQFKKLGICEDVLKVISNKKFDKPSEIQEKAIPLVLQGKDIVAGSATGSGKTLAFGAGIIKDVEKKGKVQALILTPTRELAEQVAVSLEEFSYYKKLEVVPIYGGVSIENQVKKLQYADVIVATPGRLLDHMQRNSVELDHIRYLVLDEADRMWDMGFKEDVGKIVESCPKKRQTMLFSATISQELEEFSKKYMKNPTEVSVESQVDPSKLKQVYYDVRDQEKFSLLVHLLKNENAHLVMIFCNTRRNVDFVVKNLQEQGISAQAIHGGLTQAKRTQVLKRFDNSKVNVLVATDVAARGLDISGVSHVYNYDIASDARDHVHRIGRTARAGKEGIAISILASRDYDNFAGVQKHNQDMKIENKQTPRFERVFVKMDRSTDQRRPSRGGSSRSFNRPRTGSRGPPRRGSSSGPRDSRGPDRRRPDSRGRVQRGDRNKRSSSFSRDSRGPPRRGSSSGPRDSRRSGFHGSGRNTQNRRARH